MNRVIRDRVASVLMAITILPGTGAVALSPEASTPAAPLPVALSFADPAAAAPAPAGPGDKPAVARVSDADRLTPSELEELLGPIALYPDPLLANVLAACVYPDEVAEAAKFMVRGGKSEQVDAKPWEDPVKAVAKIPDAIKMMGQYKEWVVAVGQAYLVQAKDVMDVIQSLRKKANDNGALKTTVEQKVVVEKEVVYIQPADPEIIYVPSYNPQVVYVDNYNNDAAVAGVVGFGVGIAAGLIIANNMDCHWNSGCVGWGHGGGWGHHGGDYHGGNYRSNNDLTINGDVNIGNREGNRVNSNDVRNRSGNRVGNEGNAFKPNQSKKLASSEFNQMKQFKGGETAANRSRTPGGGNRGSGGASAKNTAAGAAGRGSGAGVNGSGAAAKSGARAGNSPARPSNSAARSSGSGARSPSAGSSSRVPKTPPRNSSSGSAYSGSKSTRAESQRGAASRSRSSGSSANRSSGGGGASRSRSSGGGASRGGGGARGGGGRGGGRR